MITKCTAAAFVLSIASPVVAHGASAWLVQTHERLAAICAARYSDKAGSPVPSYDDFCACVASKVRLSLDSHEFSTITQAALPHSVARKYETARAACGG